MLDLETSHSTNIPQIQFSESANSVSLPDWFNWAFAFGHDLVEYRKELESSLLVITSPCQSPLLGIIALGSLVRILQRPITMIDRTEHFEMLFNQPAGTRVKRKNKSSKRPRVYKLLGRRDLLEGIRMNLVAGGPKRSLDPTTEFFLTPESALNYVLESEDPTETNKVNCLADYPGAAILESLSPKIPEHQNWRSNLDEIVISGPTGGNSSPKRQLTSTNLLLGENEGLALHEILAVQEWIDERSQTPHYSRFLNSSKAQVDMPSILEKSNYVFFNSIDSFLRFSDRFDKQVQVLTTARDVDSMKNERLFGKLYAFKERAVPTAPETVHSFNKPPPGLQLFFYGSKNTEEKNW